MWGYISINFWPWVLKFYLFIFETGFLSVAQDLYLRLVLNLYYSSCISLFSSGITGMRHKRTFSFSHSLSLLFWFWFIYLFYMYEFLPAYVYVYHMHAWRYPSRPEEGSWSLPWNCNYSGYKWALGCWELNPVIKPPSHLSSLECSCSGTDLHPPAFKLSI